MQRVVEVERKEKADQIEALQAEVAELRQQVKAANELTQTSCAAEE